ncbi:N-acetyltransferase B complex non catalytic subunit-domain-containing protein [Tirmania nivea]|nr:N-acetyltransferase B complex non catalytic subunit-domain-containing protein [Tirmania nivea]
MASAQDRKNQIVCESIDVGAYKQALQLCNRRIKKGEKGDYLMMLKAHVLTLLPPSPATYEEALWICREIARRKVPVEEVDVAILLQRVWSFLEGAGVGEKREGSRECVKVWEGAVKAKPGDERMAREWVFGCLRGRDWRGMQKAAMHLQKQFPKRREYYFWAVMSCLLLHNSLPETSNERKLFGMLAYRMIIKSRDEVPPEANNALLPTRAIQNAQEVHLLLSIIACASPQQSPRDRALEALSILNSKNLGLESAISKGDYLGLLRKKLSLLNEVGKWHVLWEFCGGLLQKAREPEEFAKSELPMIGDDWALWENYLNATGELLVAKGDLPDGVDRKSLKLETLKTVLGYVQIGDGKKATRNSELALVKLASLFHGQEEEGPEGAPKLVEACKRYFDTVGSKNCCFEDLGRYVEMFREEEQQEFLSYLKSKETNSEGEVTASRIAEQINIQKFIYFLRISPLPLNIPADLAISDDFGEYFKDLKLSDSTPEILEQSLITTLIQFAATNMQIYLSALTPSLSSSLMITDNQYGDDAALLAVMALLRLWKLKDENSGVPLLRAILILETLLTKSKHNYQALLLLTRLYHLIGAPYLAASSEVWGRLNVKQIQTDTLGHWLLTRGSTIFPGQINGNADLTSGTDLVRHLNRCLRIYDLNRKQTPDMTVMALDRGTYGQILEFVEFGRRLEGSVQRGMYEIDKRRAERLRGGAGAGEEVALWCKEDMLRVPEEGEVVDNRDFVVLANFEQGKMRAEEKFLRLGRELPGVRWARAFSLVEELVNVASGVKYTEPGKVLEEIYSGIMGLMKSDEEAEQGKKEFTKEEISYLTLATILSNFLISITPGAPSGTAKLAENIDTITTYFKKPAPALATPYSWRSLHTTYTSLESALLVNIVLTKAVKPQINKLKGPQGQKVKQAFQELVGVVLPGYVRSVKEAFGKLHLEEVEKRVERKEVLGGDDLGRVLSGEGMFWGGGGSGEGA